MKILVFYPKLNSAQPCQRKCKPRSIEKAASYLERREGIQLDQAANVTKARVEEEGKEVEAGVEVASEAKAGD